MAEDYGIKITKAGYDVKDTPTAATKKNYTILSTDSAHKVSTQAVVTADTNVAHGLGFRPFFDAYALSDSLTIAHPESFSAWGFSVTCDATYLYIDETWGSNSLFYIIYLDQP